MIEHRPVLFKVFKIASIIRLELVFNRFLDPKEVYWDYHRAT